jgi:hypothetical protein
MFDWIVLVVVRWRREVKAAVVAGLRWPTLILTICSKAATAGMMSSAPAHQPLRAGYPEHGRPHPLPESKHFFVSGSFMSARAGIPQDHAQSYPDTKRDAARRTSARLEATNIQRGSSSEKAAGSAVPGESGIRFDCLLSGKKAISLFLRPTALPLGPTDDEILSHSLGADGDMWDTGASPCPEPSFAIMAY